MREDVDHHIADALSRPALVRLDDRTLCLRFETPGPDGGLRCEIGKDITERKRVEAEHRFLSSASFTAW